MKVRRDGVEIEKTVVLSKLRMSGEVIATNRPTTWRGLRVDFVSTDPKVVYGEEILKAMAQGGVLVVRGPARLLRRRRRHQGGPDRGQGRRAPGQDSRRFRQGAVEGVKGTVSLTTEGDRAVSVR